MGHLCAVSGRGGGAGEFRTSRGGAPLGAAASLPGASLPGVPKAEIARFFRPFLWARTHLAGGSDFVGVTFSQLTKNYYPEKCTVPSLWSLAACGSRGGCAGDRGVQREAQREPRGPSAAPPGAGRARLGRSPARAARPCAPPWHFQVLPVPSPPARHMRPPALAGWGMALVEALASAATREPGPAAGVA